MSFMGNSGEFQRRFEAIKFIFRLFLDVSRRFRAFERLCRRFKGLLELSGVFHRGFRRFQRQNSTLQYVLGRFRALNKALNES